MHFSLDWVIIPLVFILVGFELRKRIKAGTFHDPSMKQPPSPGQILSRLARLPTWLKVGALMSALLEPLAVLGLFYSGIWIFVLIGNLFVFMAFMGIIILRLARMTLDEANEPEPREKSEVL